MVHTIGEEKHPLDFNISAVSCTCFAYYCFNFDINSKNRKIPRSRMSMFMLRIIYDCHALFLFCFKRPLTLVRLSHRTLQTKTQPNNTQNQRTSSHQK